MLLHFVATGYEVNHKSKRVASKEKREKSFHENYTLLKSDYKSGLKWKLSNQVSNSARYSNQVGD